MGEDKNYGESSPPSNIEELLQERERLDQILREKFRKEMAILFTDISGYTSYVDTRGDISGRTMLQKHNEIVVPLVEKHEGVVIKTIGDAVMASFSSPLSAVRAAAAIQSGLDEHNRNADPIDRIRVKIGINSGKAIVDQTDVFGDVVNVASRIQSEAGPDEILISSVVYEEVRSSDDILCRWHGAVQVKGKAEALKLYRVIWRDDDLVSHIEPVVRAVEPILEERPEKALRILEIEVAREGNKLKISAHEHLHGEESTIRNYEEMPVSMDWIETRCRAIVETLNRANRSGLLTREVLKEFMELGRLFYEEFLTLSVKEKLKKTDAEYLRLNLDDLLVHIPWELLNDGHKFLCQRFNMGRLVKTRQTVFGSGSRVLARPLKMLIVADPAGDLKGAHIEGTQIRESMGHIRNLIDVSLRSGNVTTEFIKEKIKNFDLVHFAGHADYNPENPEESGWRLTSSSFKAKDIMEMAGTVTMPALIFSNACQSARTDKWALRENFQYEIFGLANAFLLAGVKHYVGTFWEIQDEPSNRFAVEFYKRLLAGSTTGEAMRLARQTVIKVYGEERVVWASYLLYGDPTSSYPDNNKVPKVLDEPEPDHVTIVDQEVRTRDEAIPKRRSWWAAAAAILVICAALVFGYALFSKRESAKHEREVLEYYEAGNFEKALTASNMLEEKKPEACLAHLIRGNIYFRKGKLEVAEAAYRKALQGSDGTELWKGESLIGLGRIASVRKQPDAALKYYQHATEVSPKSKLGYLSQALIFDERGKYGEALDLLTKIQKLAPKDQVVAAMTKETRKKVVLAHDREKQERIDRLVKQLIESMKSPQRTLPSDAWTSPPLTLWIMDLKTQGYSLQEGEDRLLASSITDNLIQHGRVQIVERAVLDKLLEELKLGTSKLIDRSAALNLGRILAARLILTGQLTYLGPQTQISLRLIETETGRITAAINESFGSVVPASVLATKVSENLMNRLEKIYPIRGKVSKIEGGSIKLNIGQKAGVGMGQRFKAVNTDVRLEIIAVEPDTSTAKIITGEKGLEEEQRLEAL